MKAETQQHRVLDRIFVVSLILKGIDGVLELIGGVLLLVIPADKIGTFAQLITQHELAEDPDDLIANAIRHAAGGLSASATLFGAIYLLLHGIVKVVLVWAVLRNQLWAYPWMIGFLLVFIGFQCYQLVVGFSWGLVALTVFDAFVAWLTWREYGFHRAARRSSPAPAMD
ncbi:DUF2127 domain-containing protein [Diaminobutyricibacter sp. McL0608]|uniref:DUF2127 domain-containing protein n=1 Tax=Leifsonia sp. McL0608 TaxID=3143537 RepID=UPI0031F2F2F1